jgi:hypothetical protein
MRPRLGSAIDSLPTNAVAQLVSQCGLSVLT